MKKTKQKKKTGEAKKKSSRRGKEPKYIFVTGGVVSGIGKGITAAAIGTLLKSRGISFFHIKIDPYLNRDAGTMNPYQHGEVFVLKDGTETDLDLGHYERFSGIELDRSSNFTTGAVYESVMNMERRGDFLGKTIQIIPHVTDEIKRRVIAAGKEKKAEVVIVEIGGTVGDIEAEPFLEAARQMLHEFGPARVSFLHVVKIDYIFPSDEEKTKPIQQSVILLRARGIQPDFLVVRSKREMTKTNREKISLFTNVPVANIIPAVDVSTLYEVPLNFKHARLDVALAERLRLSNRKSDLKVWASLVRRMGSVKNPLRIALIGKYTAHADSYISVEEALRHAALHAKTGISIERLDADKPGFGAELRECDGVIIPGGFGKRGSEGKIEAVRIARAENLPFLGLCLGLQIAVIEFARHVCGLRRASSTEFDAKTPYPVIDILPDQVNVKLMGATMRLGAMGLSLRQGTRAREIYGAPRVSERHRHRYEVNPFYHTRLLEGGLVFSAFAEKNKNLVDMIELPDHPFFVGTQAHPEFQSRFTEPHPLFSAFVKAAMKRKKETEKLKKGK
jgi:CTP synthase